VGGGKMKKKDIWRSNPDGTHYPIIDKGMLPSPEDLRQVPDTEHKKNILISTKEAILGQDAETEESKLINKNIRKAMSNNPIEKLEGRVWLDQNYPTILAQLLESKKYLNEEIEE
jgi:hypothetical protein